MIPSALKKQLANSLQDGFVLKRSVFQPCLELYPMTEWNLNDAKNQQIEPLYKERTTTSFVGLPLV